MLIRELSRLGTSYNDEANRLVAEMRKQADTVNEKVETIEVETIDEVGGMACETLGCDVSFYAAMKLEGKPTTQYNENHEGKNVDELMDALDLVLNDKTLNEEMKNEKLRSTVQQLKHYTPATFQEAWNHPCAKFRERFREAIHKEF